MPARPSAKIQLKSKRGLAKEIPGLLADLLAQAKAGDTQVAMFLVNKVVGNAAPSAGHLEISLDAKSNSLADKSAAVVDAVTSGQLDTALAEKMLNLFQTHLKITELASFDSRLAALEARDVTATEIKTARQTYQRISKDGDD